MLKCQLHTHVYGDPVDHIAHTAKQLIERAALLKYEVLAITCHRTIFFNNDLKNFAAKKNILLVAGIEFEINKKHILGINVNDEILKVDSFEKLNNYKSLHPDCLIIAAHPFFPGPSLGKMLIKNIDCFDAIEYSWAYTKLINFNKKAEKTALRYQKPLLATSDCHILNYLDLGYILVNADKNPLSVIKAIKENRFKNRSRPTNSFRIARGLGKVVLQTAGRKLFAKKKT